ncbi:uncharacterized protein TNCV_686931 [Trichonephila clavipes]|nr:uncharacterized protein TNCV_686931 [Trichonephila clavipes]
MAIEKRVQRNPRVSMRQIARDMGISDRSPLPEKYRLVRLRRCRKLLRRAASQRWERFLFTDEKLFTVPQVHNSPNDRTWCVDAPRTSALVEHHQYPKSVMVWGGICASGKTPLVFMEEGVKINQKMYRRGIIEADILPWYQKHFENANWTLRQEVEASAPV